MVPMTVMQHLLEGFCGGVEEHLVVAVGSSRNSDGADGHRALAQLLQEDPATVKEREALTSKLASLKSSHDVLRRFKGSH